MDISFLGDIHGAFDMLGLILEEHLNETIVQVGDMGIGLPSYQIWDNTTQQFILLGKPPKTFPDNFYFLRGNHDDPSKCKKYPNYLGDFGFNESLGIFYVSGGRSIDAAYRTAGIDFWNNEQLSIPQLNECVELYSKIKPTIVVSHECPDIVNKSLANFPEESSRTSMALQRMFEIWKPKYHIFGHHHKAWRKNIQGTEFICCDINQTINVTI